MGGKDFSAELFDLKPADLMTAPPEGRDFSADLFGDTKAATTDPVGTDFSAELFGDAPAAEPPDSVSFKDYLAAIKRGSGNVVAGAGWLVDKVAPEGTPLSTAAKMAQLSGGVDQSIATDAMSDAAKAENQKQFVTRDSQKPWYDPTAYSRGDAGLQSVALSATESIPGTAAGMLAGGGFANMFKLVPKLSPVIANALGYGAGEGIISAASSGQQTEQQVRSMPIEQLQESPEYQAALHATGSPDAARDIVARAAGNDSAAISGLTSFVLGAPSGLMVGKLFGDVPLETTRLRAIGFGAAGEAAQEFAQSGAEQMAQNIAIKENANPNQDLGEGVLNAAVAGAASGALMGGGMGFVAPLEQKQTKNSPVADQSKVAEGEIARAQRPAIDINTMPLADMANPNRAPLTVDNMDLADMAAGPSITPIDATKPFTPGDAVMPGSVADLGSTPPGFGQQQAITAPQPGMFDQPLQPTPVNTAATELPAVPEYSETASNIPPAQVSRPRRQEEVFGGTQSEAASNDLPIPDVSAAGAASDTTVDTDQPQFSASAPGDIQGGVGDTTAPVAAGGSGVSGADAASNQQPALSAPDSRDATGKQASWVVRNKETGDVVMETFDRKKVEALNTEKYEAVSIAEHLAGLNRSVAAQQPSPSAPPPPVDTINASPEPVEKQAENRQEPDSRPVIEGEYRHADHPDAVAQVTKTDKGYQVEWSPDDVQEFRGKNAAEKLRAALSREKFQPNNIDGVMTSDEGAELSRAEQNPDVSNMDQREGSVPQSEEPLLSQLRRQGDQDLPGMDPELRSVSGGSGRASEPATYVGSGGERRKLRAGERLLGDEESSSEQSAQERESHGERSNKDNGGVGAGNESGAISNTLPAEQGDDARGSGSDAAANGATAGVYDGAGPLRSKASVSNGAISDIDASAHEAATSPLNDIAQPTDAQIEAGNYRVGRVKLHGLDISIENPKGSTRSGKRPDGSTWSHEMSDHYGYIRRTTGADGEHVDVYVGPVHDAAKVFVVDQVNQADGSFDETKVMLGFKNRIKAVNAYKSNFDKGWKVGPVTEMSIEQFKEWLKGDTTKPLAGESTKPGTPESPKAKAKASSIRAPWNDFPPVETLLPLKSLENADKDLYKAAKAGDPEAAFHLVGKVLTDEGVAQISAALNGRQATLVPIIGLERTGQNQIPLAYAEALSRALDLPVTTDIVQTVKAGHTGAGAFERIAKQPTFDGAVEPGESYVILDDTVTMGGTIAGIRGYIEGNGGRVLFASTLTGFERQLNITPTRSMLTGIQAKHGKQLADWWQSESGFPLEQLTQGELGHLRASPSIDAIRDRISAGKREAVPADNAQSGETESQVAPLPQENDQQPPKIDDFGEVLHGAKKHYAAAYADKMNSALEADIAAVPLSQSWPEPDYNKLIESGAEKDAVAWARALRDEVADKPRSSWKVKGWAEKVAILRNFASDILSGEASADAVRKAAAAKPLLGSVVGRADLYEEFGHDISLKGVTFRQRHFTRYRGEENVTKWMIERPAKASAFSNWPQELGVGNTREEAIAQFRKNIEKLANQSETKGKSVRFDIYSRRGETGFIIGKKVGKNYIDLMRFDSAKEARAYLQDNQAALEEKLSRMKEIPRERRETNAPRIGVDHRNGGDVTPEQFSEALGFRGVQFGTYVEGKRRQQDLNNAYDALMDLAGVLNLPPKALSLNGTLGLAFGARGSGGKNPASAHYEPDTVVINLTKNGGAGSLAHELWHAIDNYFSRMRGDKGEFVTEYPRQKLPGDDRIRPEMIEAFSQLTRAINQSRLKQRSQMLDNRRSKAYWTTGREMSARSFESYIIAKLQDQGASNDYLANIVSEDYWNAAEALGLEGGGSYPYPQAAEIPKIRAAFDEFFQTVETKETDSGVAMFSLGDDSNAAIGEDGSISKVEADEVIASVTARWGKPDIVNLVDRFTDLPPAIKRAAAAHRASPNQVKGAIHNGRLYVVRENHKTAASLARTVFHEAYGHYGIRALFGKEIHQKLNQLFIAIGGVRGFNEMAARHGVDLKLYRGMDNLPQEMRRAAMMEELLSHMAEDQRPSIARRAKEIIGMVRAWLRKHGFPLLSKLGDTDIAHLLKQARERTIAGDDGSIIAKPAFSLRDQTETPAFKRWFGDSKVVDNSFANLLSQPDGVGILLRDLLAAQNASGSGLNPVQALMLALAKNDKIGRGIVGLVPVDVVNSFTKDGFRPEDGGGNTSMFVNALNTPVSDQVLSTFRGILTSLSAKLANTIATGRDQEVGPALLASDFNLREMGALLSLQGRADFWGGDAGVESVGASKAAKSSSASLRPPTENLKLSPAALADLLNKFVSFAPHSKSSISDDLPSSKYIAEQGKPLVVYHGTGADITEFSLDASAKELSAMVTGVPGIYFAPSPEVAGDYAFGKDGANVIPSYLALRNPKEVVYAELIGGTFDRASLEAQGHDGLTVKRGGKVWAYIAFRPEQIKSAIGNNGSFDPDSADIMFSLQDDEQTHDALAKLGLAPKKRKTLASIIAQYTQRDWKSLLRQLGSRSYEGWVDGLIGIKRAEESLGVGIGKGDYQRSGYVGARLATGIADVMHGIMFYGAPEWRDGVTSYRHGTKGLLDVLSQLEGSELTEWLAWMGANRAQELMNQGRENNLTQDEIDILKAGARGNEAKFEQVRQDYLTINKAMLDLAENVGLIEPAARTQWESEWYVPFYRMSEADGEAALLGPTTKRGLSHQSSGIRALKGGDIATNDLLENIVANWLKLADASLKNEAIKRTVDLLDGSDMIKDESMRWSKVVVPRAEIVKKIEGDRVALEYWAEQFGMDDTANALEVAHELNALSKEGFESLWQRVAPTDKDIVRVMREGKAHYYRITADDGGALLRALTQVRGDRVDNVLLRAGRWSKRLLTTGVTASPEFILRNFIRDAAHAWAINPDGFRFGVDSLRGLREAWQEDEAYRTLMFTGASFQGGYVHGTDPEASAQIIRRALEKKGLTPTQIEGHLSTVINSAAKAKDLLKMGWQHYREVGDKVENANRLATFKAALAAGKPVAQAAFEAKDLMDYSRRGNMAAATFFMDVIPFLGARIQGLDKLARAGIDNHRLVGAALLKIALWSVFLAWLNDDEDKYKELPDWEKDAYWHIFIGDSHWRIPKPFEIGFLAGTIPERMYHAWIADTQPDEKVLWSMGHGMMETLNFNPIPQGVLPIAEIVANKSFYFGTPIESQRDQNVQPEARYDAFTSNTAVLAGKALGLSPKQIEHLWTGYTGTMGGYALSLADMFVRGVTSAPDRPAMRPEDLVLVRALYRGEDEPRSTQYQIDFYNRLREVEQIYGTAKQYAKEGDREESREKIAENRDKLRYRGLLNATADQLSALRKREKAIMENRNMPAGEKRLKLNAINQRRNQILQRASEKTEGAF